MLASDFWRISPIGEDFNIDFQPEVIVLSNKQDPFNYVFNLDLDYDFSVLSGYGKHIRHRLVDMSDEAWSEFQMRMIEWCKLYLKPLHKLRLDAIQICLNDLEYEMRELSLEISGLQLLLNNKGFQKTYYHTLMERLDGKNSL